MTEHRLFTYLFIQLFFHSFLFYRCFMSYSRVFHLQDHGQYCSGMKPTSARRRPTTIGRQATDLTKYDQQEMDLSIQQLHLLQTIISHGTGYTRVSAAAQSDKARWSISVAQRPPKPSLVSYRWFPTTGFLSMVSYQWFPITGFPSLRVKVCLQPADGRRFRPGTAWFCLTIMLYVVL